MLGFLRRLFRNERGNALMIAAGALPLVIGSAGLASDTVQWATWKRQLQRSADSAALAGVYAIVQSNSYDAAVTRDLAINSHVGITTGKTVTLSPAGYSTDPYAVKVRLTVQKRLGFSSVFLSTTPTVAAEAVATVVANGVYCVKSLQNTNASGLLFSGNANVTLRCGMSTNAPAQCGVDAGGSSSITATPIAAVGGICGGTNFGSGTTMQPYSMKQRDPFASINPPTPTGSCPTKNVNNNTTLTVTAGACYSSLTINGTANLTGEILLDGGGLNIGSQAVVNCTGCVFILTTRSTTITNNSIGTVDINGGAQVNMTAPTTGTYAGILIYQDRRALDAPSNNNYINGNALSSLQGALYFPGQEVQFSGSSGMSTNCLQMVGWRVKFTGNTTITNSCPTGSGAKAFDGSMIRLVA